MKTRCPNCKLIYNIRSSALKKADFKVVCSECHHVFTVKGSPAAPDDSLKLSKAADADIQIDDLQPDSEMQELLVQLQDSVEKQENRQRSKPDPEVRETGGTPDRAQNASAEEESSGSELPDTQPLEDTLTKNPPEKPVDKDQTEAGEEIPFTPELTPPKKTLSALAFLSVIILLSAALLQIAWIERDRLLEHPRLRSAAETACSRIGCTLPPSEKQIPAFSVLDRALTADETHPGAYRLDILLRNDSKAPQKLPALQLSLMDHLQETFARRTFAPRLYATDADSSIGAGELLEIHLLLLPSRKAISGFELDFIPADS